MDGIVRILLFQCYGSRSALNLVGWIRIQIQEVKKMTQTTEKVMQFHVLKGWMCKLQFVIRIRIAINIESRILIRIGIKPMPIHSTRFGKLLCLS
jgi:hypothetical protein